jgi:uncharacterized protein
VALVGSVRGTGGAPGKLDPFGRQEQDDSFDLIEWLAAQSFSTGKVGQTGISYGGHNTLLAAVNQPPHLTAVIPVQAISDWYENTIYRGGIPNEQIHEWQATTAPETLDIYPQHPLYDDFWRERSVKARWDKLTIPVLDVGGWLDPYLDAMVQNFVARQESVWMVAGPWSHGMIPGQFEDIASAAYLAWWDHWLADLPAPLPKTKVTSYEMPGPGAGHGWQQFSTWSPAESERTARILAAVVSWARPSRSQRSPSSRRTSGACRSTHRRLSTTSWWWAASRRRCESPSAPRTATSPSCLRTSTLAAWPRGSPTAGSKPVTATDMSSWLR